MGMKLFPRLFVDQKGFSAFYEALFFVVPVGNDAFPGMTFADLLDDFWVH